MDRNESIYIVASDEEDDIGSETSVFTDLADSWEVLETVPPRRESSLYSYIPSSSEKFTVRPKEYSYVPSSKEKSVPGEREYEYVPHSNYKKPRPNPFVKPYKPKKPKQKAESKQNANLKAKSEPQIIRLVPGQCPEPEQFDNGCRTLFDQDWSTYTQSTGGGSKVLRKKLLLETHPDKAELEASAMYPYRECSAFKTHCFDKVQRR